MTLSKSRPAEGDQPVATQAFIRPDDIKKAPHISVHFRYPTKDITTNYPRARAVEVVGDLLRTRFAIAHLFTTGADFELRTKRMRQEQKHIQSREKLYDRDYQDLLEYIKWISGDLSMLRDRGRISEKIISDLKQSGEESVDSLMSTLTHHKHRQDALDREVDGLRFVVNQKEREIAVKEGDITNLKRLIELETNEKEVEIRRIKSEIEEQTKVMENQQKIIRELQVLNDFTQTDLIQATSELQQRIRERNDLQLRYLDSDHETANMNFKQQTLREQAVKLQQQIQVLSQNTSVQM
jgi:chromosome segregation ATPase